MSEKQVLSTDPTPRLTAMLERMKPGYPKNKDLLAEHVFSRGHRISPKQLDELKSRFPTWEFSFGAGPLHPHAVGATERAILEQEVIEKITVKHGHQVNITDIGGNANRHALAGRGQVHSCNPIISAADALRRSPDNYVAGANYCNQLAQDCPFVPDVYLAIHSLYYLTKEEILLAVCGCNLNILYAVQHSFQDIYGHMQIIDKVPESTYQVIVPPGCTSPDDLMVHMTVNGNHTGYSHPAQLWLQATNYFDRGDIAMAWESVRVGDSYIYTFRKVACGLQSEESHPLTLCQSIRRSDHYGSTSGIVCSGDTKGLQPVLEVAQLQTTTTFSFGRWTGSYSKKAGFVLVSKGFVAALGNEMIGLERNEKTFTTCTNKARKMVKGLNIPDSMKTMHLTYGTSMAFLYSIEHEIDAFNVLRTPKSRGLFDRLAAALHFSPMGCCIDNVNIVGEREENEAALRKMYTREYVTPAFRGSANGRVAFDRGLPGFQPTMPLKNMKKGSEINDRDVEEKAEHPSQMFVNCIAFTPIQAVVPIPSKESERLALVNRAMVDTPTEDKDLWAKVQAHSTELVKDFEEIEGTYDELFTRWNSKYPKAKAALHLAAYIKVMQGGVSKADLLFKMFVKREVTLKTGSEVEDFDPRAIQGCSDEMNVCFGPFIWALSDILAKNWSAEERIFYTCGATAEQIGAWRQRQGDIRVTLVELDESRFDAHQGAGCHTNAKILKDKCNMQGYELPSYVDLNSFVKHGRSRFWTYRVNGTMTSGKADTSCSNSFNNGAKLDYLLSERYSPNEYNMIVNGDDSLVVIHKELNPAEQCELRDYLVSQNRRLGFTTKCKVSTEWSEVEYCSGLFWPVDGGFVLGPKVGRRLPKLGFGIRELQPAEIVSMVRGMEKDLSHIPVLSSYFMACQKLVNKIKITKGKEFIDKEAKYKNLCSKRHVATAETEAFFMARYNISAERADESMKICLGLCETITDVVHFPLMSHFSRDL